MTIQIDQSYIDDKELVIVGHLRVVRDDDPTSQQLFDLLKFAIETITAAQLAHGKINTPWLHPLVRETNPQEAP